MEQNQENKSYGGLSQSDLETLAKIVVQEKIVIYNEFRHNGTPGISYAEAYQRALTKVYESIVSPAGDYTLTREEFAARVGQIITAPAIKGKIAAAERRRAEGGRKKHKGDNGKVTTTKTTPPASKYITEIIPTSFYKFAVSPDMLEALSKEVDRDLPSLAPGESACLVLAGVIEARLAEALTRYSVAESRGWTGGVSTSRYGRVLFVRRNMEATLATAADIVNRITQR